MIEFTSTNEDVGVQLFLGLLRLGTGKRFTPHGRQIFEATAAVRLFRQGRADLLLLLKRAATACQPLLLIVVVLLSSAVVAVARRSVQPLRV
jgi:hypothetical protein